MSDTLKALVAAACIVVLAGGFVMARDRYKTSSCQSAGRLYDYALGHLDILSPEGMAVSDAYQDCVNAGWIGARP